MNKTPNKTPQKSKSYLQALTMLLSHKFLLVSCILLTFVVSLSGAYLLILSRNVIDTLEVSTNTFNTALSGFVLRFILFASISSFSLFSQSILTTVLVEKVLLKLRQDVVGHSLSLSMDYFSNEPTGKLITLTTSDLDSIGSFFRSILSQFLTSGISFFVLLFALFVLNWVLALITLCTVPVIFLFVNIYRKRILRYSREVRTATVAMNTYTSEHLHGKLDLQLHGKLEDSQNTFDTIADKQYQASYLLALQEIFLNPMLNLILIGIIVLVIVFGSYFASIAIVSIGTIIAFIQLIKQFFFPVITVAQNITQIQESLVSLDKVFEFLRVQPAIRQHKTDEVLPDIHKGELRFEHVDFSYKTEQKVLHDINFTLQQNKTLALVGHSGSGKSTIAKLCVRFWDPQAGTIRIDGIDIRKLAPSQLRENISLLHQDSLIFQGSLRENIQMGRTINQGELEKIIEKSGLAQIMRKSNWTLDSEISKQKLSVGEQRIVAICRVLVAAPKILLLDEFSATLDSETEIQVQTLLKELQKERTTLVIAHRLNTIRNADEILFLRDGGIIERGTHDSLLAARGHYYTMLQNMHETIVSNSSLSS